MIAKYDETNNFDGDKRKEIIGIIIKLLENAKCIGVSSDLSFRSETCDYTIHIYDAPASLLQEGVFIVDV